jgi:hypothetical protein
MRQRPERPYRNFAEFLDYIPCNLTGYKYPCCVCGGCGRVWITWEVKGEWNKGTEEKCKACEGSGKGTKKACQEEYRQVINRWKEEAGMYDRLKEAKKEALKKLTKEEVKALQELGV